MNLLLAINHRQDEFFQALELGGPPIALWSTTMLKNASSEAQEALIQQFATYGRSEVWGQLGTTRFSPADKPCGNPARPLDGDALLALLSWMIRADPKDRMPCLKTLREHVLFKGQELPEFLARFH